MAGFIHPVTTCDRFLHVDARANELRKRLTSHSGVANEFMKYAKSKGWESTNLSQFDSLSASSSGVPDLILYNNDTMAGKRQMLSIEVKPGNCTIMEARKGLGQCLFHLNEDLRPYLVVPLAFEGTMVSVFDRVKLVGLISYAYSGGTLVFKHSYGDPL
jgi:hypothetical protein